MAGSGMTNYDTIMGRMVVDQFLCTEKEVRLCIEEKKIRSPEDPITLEELLLDKQFVTNTQIERLRNLIRESKDVSSQIPGYKILGKLGS